METETSSQKSKRPPLTSHKSSRNLVTAATTAFQQQWGLLLCTGLSLVAHGGLVRMQWLYGTLRDRHTPETIGWYLLAFVAYLGALVWAEKRSISRRWLWGAAVLFRLLLLFTVPSLSDDVYRYLWDGHVAHNGISPYAYAIEDPRLDHLEVPVRTQANNTWMASPYLPAAQLVFSSLTFAFPLNPLFVQMAMVVFDLLGAWLLSRLLLLAALPTRRLLLYLWNPLMVVEVAHSAHIDAWMILLALLAVTFSLDASQQSSRLSWSSKFRWLLAPLFLALATLTKLLPVLLLPVLFWRWSWRQRLFYGVATIGLLLPSGLRAGWGLTGELDGRGLFGAARIYGTYWNFNSGLFHWLEVALGAPGFGAPSPRAKIIVLLVMGLLLAGVWLLARQRPSPRANLRLMALPFAAYLLLTPTLHPWYALILLAFLPFWTPAEKESRWLWLAVLPWLYLSASLVFSYLTYLDPNQYAELAWVRRLEWLPTLALLLLALTAVPIHYRRSTDSVSLILD